MARGKVAVTVLMYTVYITYKSFGKKESEIFIVRYVRYIYKNRRGDR